MNGARELCYRKYVNWAAWKQLGQNPYYPVCMKPLGYVAITAAILAGGAYAAFELTRPGFPVSRVIVNQEGKELEAKILGKWDGALTVERIADGQRFDLSVNTLSLADRAYALRLREEKAPPPPAPEPSAKPEDPYITSRRKAINDLKERANIYTVEINSGTLSDLLHQARIEQLAKVQMEIKNLEVAIETYKFRSRTQ